MTFSAPSLDEQKRLMRVQMREKGRVRSADKSINIKELQDVFTAHVQLEVRRLIGAYHAIQDELDPTALIQKLQSQGHSIALPAITGKNKPLSFRLYEKGDPLELNAFGIPEPMPDAQLVEPDILLVPLLAFDRQRNRLGYGGGYYDRTIAHLRTHKPVQSIGLAYAFQEVPRVPTGSHDIPLNQIVTELGVF